MAWVPSSRFEDDLVDMEPNFNFVYGQLAYEVQKKRENTPRPKSTYEYLSARRERNEELDKQHGHSSGKGREIRSCLQMMEKIQTIAGTKPLGEHATMADWEDTSTVEQEAVAMMRHFGLMSMDVEARSTKPKLLPNEKEEESQPEKVKITRNGRRTFPLITDPDYFRPRKTRKPKDADSSDTTSDTSYHTAPSESSFISLYGSAQSTLSNSYESKDRTRDCKEYLEIPYEPLEESFTDEAPKEQSEKVLDSGTIAPKKKKKQRPSQKKRLQSASQGKQYQL
ncbi:uncharacterized protein squ [Drosophila bipectinata]|uniref:uncharacterized protein squ n=1 Tax=Drosophila bipectinata TaxID=42026 RepID=UPI001C890997|nr:uncharacterized protein LOC108130919 [Drosophila bipectinata]XP_043067356.1 uncharacterized protein LOC108130919 [Drosophila bipectinata]